MYESCLAKQEKIKEFFAVCKTQEAIYQKIIELGKTLPFFPEEYKQNTLKVSGCQSTVYLHSILKNEKVRFQIFSDALISKGLAALLFYVYNEETPETILKCSPTYLEDLHLEKSLTPSRSNGLYSIHLKMKQEALKLLMQ